MFPADGEFVEFNHSVLLEGPVEVSAIFRSLDILNKSFQSMIHINEQYIFVQFSYSFTPLYLLQRLRLLLRYFAMFLLLYIFVHFKNETVLTQYVTLSSLCLSKIATLVQLSITTSLRRLESSFQLAFKHVLAADNWFIYEIMYELLQ